MTYARRSPWLLALALSAALACGKEGDDTLGGSSEPGTTVDTTGSTDLTTTVTVTDADTTDTPTTDPSTSGVDVSGFERFKLARAAGPCPPDADCDGFIELLADGTLRFEEFGELDNPVQEATISPADLAAAIPVFADPDLIALLDGPDPACDPPTDVFESMTAQIEASEHQATTTFCEQPPIAAARELANMLQMQYLP